MAEVEGEKEQKNCGNPISDNRRFGNPGKRVRRITISKNSSILKAGQIGQGKKPGLSGER
jgi:hypothetical protein